MPLSAPSIDAVVEDFERAWHSTPDLDLSSFLPEDSDPLYREALRELIRIDLEFGWGAGRQRPLDEYLVRFPELKADPETLSAIAFEEFRLRRQAGFSPSPEEYASRYQIRTEAWQKQEEAPPSVRLEEAARAFGEFRLGDVPTDIDSWTPPGELRSDAGQFFLNLAKIDAPAADRLATGLTTMPQPGTTFAGFDLISELGKGAFGRVFLARQEVLAGRLVALKVAPGDADESQTLAQLQHTNIVPIYSVHRAAPLQAVCMPYLGSATVAGVIDEIRKGGLPADGLALLCLIRAQKRPAGAPEPGPLAPPVANALRSLSYTDAALWLVGRLAEGLAHAHERGVLHRDIKPANILVGDDGTPMLLDFNLAEDVKQRELGGATLGGTLPYMAPEQLSAFLERGGPIDARCDLYSLGIVLYELLTGMFPFGTVIRGGATQDERIRHLLDARRDHAPCPRLANPNVSPAVAAIVRRCLAPDREQRYASAAELREDIDRHLRDEPLLHAGNPSLIERGRKWLRRHPRALFRGSVAAGVLMLVLAIGLGSVAFGFHRSEEARKRRTAFREDYHLSQFLLNTRPPTGDQRRQGEEVCRRALSRYRVLEDSGWRTRWQLTSLPTAEQALAVGEIGELLLLLARTTGQDDDRLVDAVRIHDESARCFAPDEPLALQRQAAWLAERAGKSEAADAIRRSLESREPETVRDRYLMARELTTEARFREARALLEPALRQAPNDFWAWFLMGVCREGLGQDAEAVTCYSVCIALESDFSGSYHNRGLAYLRMNKAEDACADFDRALALAPDRAELYLDRSLAHAASGRLKAALADLDSAIERKIPMTRVYLLRARVRAQLGDRVGAAKDRAEGLALTPTDETSWIVRGLARMHQHPLEALKDFDQALKLNPRSRAALMNRAHVLAEKLDRQKEADEALERVLSAYPDHAPALAGRAVVLARMKERSKAHESIAEALSHDNGGETRYQAACVFALTSRGVAADADVALTHLRKALDAKYGLSIVETDPDLEPIRDRAEFARTLEAAKELQASAK